MSRSFFLIGLILALANAAPQSAAESKTNDAKLLVEPHTSEKAISADDKKKASDEIGRLGLLPPTADDHETQLKSAVKDDVADSKKEDSVIKLKYEPKKDVSGRLEDEEGLWKKLKSFLKQNPEVSSAKSNQQMDDEMKKFWDTFYYKDESDKTDIGQSKLETQVGVESRILETKDVKRKIKEKEQGVGTETLFDLGEKLFDQSFDSDSENVKILSPSAAATKKRIVSKVVYADEVVAGDQMLEEKDDQVLVAEGDKWGVDELHKVVKEEKASDRKKKQKAEDPFKKTSFGSKVDEEKIHEERTVSNTAGGGGYDPRSILRGYLPSFGQGNDDDYDDDSSNDEDDDYNDDDDDDGDDEREDSSVWLRRAISNSGIGGRIPLFLDSNLNLYVPIRIPTTTSSSNGPTFPGFQNNDGNGNQGGRNGGGQRFSRITELVGKEKKVKTKAFEIPFIKAREAEHRFGMLLYPWVPLKDLVEKVEDAMKELNIKANQVEAKTGAPLFEFGFEIIDVKEKKFMLETRTVKDPEGKRRVHVTLLAVKPITAEEAKKVEELKEEKKIIDELLDRKKELHELWLKRKESKAEELSKEKLEKAELLKALFGINKKSDDDDE